MLNIWKTWKPFYLQKSVNCHFLLPDRRRRARAEEKCNADLSRNERGVLESMSAEDTDAVSEVEVQCSADASPVCLGAEHGWAPLAWAGGPSYPPGFPFPSPSRWAWNVEVCCSKEKKLSCTLSNCEERGVLSPGGLPKPINNICLFAVCTCSMLDWSNSSGQTDSLLQLTLLLVFVWLQVNSCGTEQKGFLSKR